MLLCIKAGAVESDVREAFDTGFQTNHGTRARSQGLVEDGIVDAEEDGHEQAAA